MVLVEPVVDWRSLLMLGARLERGEASAPSSCCFGRRCIPRAWVECEEFGEELEYFCGSATRCDSATAAQLPAGLAVSAWESRSHSACETGRSCCRQRTGAWGRNERTVDLEASDTGDFEGS